MRDTTVAEPDTDGQVAAEVAGTRPAVVEPAGRRRSLVLATAISVAAAALATALAMVLSRRRRAATQAEQPASRERTSPTSTINVNWAVALFGTNVMADRRRGRLLGRRR